MALKLTAYRDQAGNGRREGKAWGCYREWEKQAQRILIFQSQEFPGDVRFPKFVQF